MPQSPKKTTVAAALEFDTTEMSTPKVNSIGRGKIAREMMTIARRYGIPIHKDDSTTKKLSVLEEDSYIPPDTYETIAAITQSS